METRQIILAARPTGIPTLDNFKIENTSLPDLMNDQVLVEILYYSVDPYMRGRMNANQASFEIGKPIEGGVVAKVIESKSSEIKVGDLISGRLPWRVRTLAPAKGLKIINDKAAPASYYLGVLGMPGLTAYFGLMDIGKPQEGQTVVVSAAAGAVGVVVGQIARIQGCRVIGIAGSDEKVNLLKTEYGFDEAINYKTSDDLMKALAQICPNGVDVYYDNVGGEISDAVISHINHKARIIVCGQISTYNSSEISTGPRLQPLILLHNALMQGFSVNEYQNRFDEGLQQLTKWIREGKVKFPETKIKGFDQLPSAFIGLFKGENMGKMIVEA